MEIGTYTTEIDIQRPKFEIHGIYGTKFKEHKGSCFLGCYVLHWEYIGTLSTFIISTTLRKQSE